jgi:hypothetical protein
VTSNKIIKAGTAVIALSILTACGGSPHPRPISNAAATGASAAIELRSEVHANHLYFPAGSYALVASDKIGYYYRSPRKVLQHTVANSFPREGGLFVSKRDRTKIRGYIYLGGAITHVGNFSHADYAFRGAGPQEDIPAESPY